MELMEDEMRRKRPLLLLPQLNRKEGTLKSGIVPSRHHSSQESGEGREEEASRKKRESEVKCGVVAEKENSFPLFS